MVGLDDSSRRRSYGRMAGLGMQFGAAIVLFALAGHWLDGRLGTRPLLVVLGVLLGFAGGTISLVKAVAPGRDERANDPTRPPTPEP